MIYVRLQDQNIMLRFPDDTSEDVMRNEILKNFYPLKYINEPDDLQPSHEEYKPYKTPDLGMDIGPADSPFSTPPDEPPTGMDTIQAHKPPGKYGYRVDGTPKDVGFLGELPRPDGGVSTELSMGVDFDGKERLIPLLVPDLTKDEVDFLLKVKPGDAIPKDIVDKAVQHARDRIDQGFSPFFSSDELATEERSLPPGMPDTLSPAHMDFTPEKPKDTMEPDFMGEAAGGPIRETAQPLRPFEDQPDFMGEPAGGGLTITGKDTTPPAFPPEVGEPSVFAEAADVPFKYGRGVATAPGPFTGEDPFAIEEKGASIAHLGGLTMGNISQFFHDMEGPKKVAYKPGELKPFEAGYQVGSVAATLGVEMVTAGWIMRALGGVMGEDGIPLAYRLMKVKDRDLVVQDLQTMIKEMDQAGKSSTEILRAIQQRTKDAKLTIEEMEKYTQATRRGEKVVPPGSPAEEPIAGQPPQGQYPRRPEDFDPDKFDFTKGLRPGEPGARAGALEEEYARLYEAQKQYPDADPKDLVRVTIYEKGGPDQEPITFRFATRDNVEEVVDQAHKDYPGAYITQSYDLTAYRPQKGEMQYSEYKQQRDAGVERPQVGIPKPDQFPEGHFYGGAEKINTLKGHIRAGVNQFTVIPQQVASTTKGKGKSARELLLDQVKKGSKVMVDNEAYPTYMHNEKVRKTGKGQAKTTDWDRVIEWQEQFVKDAGEDVANVSVVAPDVIGDQEQTLAMQKKYGPRFEAMANQGATIIIPIQKGNRPPGDAWMISRRLIGVENTIVGVPKRKSGFTDEMVRQLMSGTMRPARIHLLGVSDTAEEVETRMAIIKQLNPEAVVTWDSTSAFRKQVGEGKRVTTRRKQVKEDLIAIDEEEKWDETQDLYTDWPELLEVISEEEKAKLIKDHGPIEEWGGDYVDDRALMWDMLQLAKKYSLTPPAQLGGEAQAIAIEEEVRRFQNPPTEANTSGEVLVSPTGQMGTKEDHIKVIEKALRRVKKKRPPDARPHSEYINFWDPHRNQTWTMRNTPEDIEAFLEEYKKLDLPPAEDEKFPPTKAEPIRKKGDPVPGAEEPPKPVPVEEAPDSEVKPDYDFKPGKNFQESKNNAMATIDEAIKKAKAHEKKYGKPETESWGPNRPRKFKRSELIRFRDPENATIYDVINTVEALQQFKKYYKSYTATTKAKKPSVATTRPQKPKEKWFLDKPLYVWKKEGWVSDGAIIIKSKPPALKHEVAEDAPDFDLVKEMFTKNLTEATGRYFFEHGEFGYVISKFPEIPAKMGTEPHEFQYVVFKVGKHRFYYDAQKWNIINNRYPKATYKANAADATEHMPPMLLAYDNGKPVAVLAGHARATPGTPEPGEEIAKQKGFYERHPKTSIHTKKVGMADTGGYGDVSAFADIGGDYATNVQELMDLPEIVEIGVGIMDGKYPGIRRIIDRDPGVLGQLVIERKGRGIPGDIEIKADLFADAKRAAATVAHEIGHFLDYLTGIMAGKIGREAMKRNLLGRMAHIYNFMKETLPRWKGAPGELTNLDRQRIRREAKKIIETMGSEEWIDEVIRKEMPITPQDILNIWNAMIDAKKINPDLYAYIQQIGTAQKKAIVKAAFKGEVPEELQKFAKVVEEYTGKKVKRIYTQEELNKMIKEKYAELLNEEIAKRKLFDLFDITEELKKLTHAWKPFDPAARMAYTIYRYSSHELYADAFSALINAPGLVKQVAPNFYEGFFNYINEKPEFKEIYDSIQDDIRHGSGRIEDRLDRRAIDGFRRGDDALGMRYVRSLKASIKAGFNELMIHAVDRWWPIFKDQKYLKDLNIIASKDPFVRLRMLDHTGAGQELIARDFFFNIVEPLERANLNWEEFGLDLLYRRVVYGDRGPLANPLGIHPDRANKQLEYRRQNRTVEQRRVMAQMIARINLAHQQHLQWIQEQGVYDPAFIEELKKNLAYVPWDVAEAVERRYGRGISAGIFPQVGTLKEIVNPATSMVMKHMAMHNAILYMRAKKAVADYARLAKEAGFAVRYEEPEWEYIERPVSKTQTIKMRRAKSPVNPELGVIQWLENGKQHAAYVDKWYAKMFKYDDSNNWMSARALRAGSQFFKTLYVEVNLGFSLISNPTRDFWSFWAKMPQATLRETLKYYIKGMKPAWRRLVSLKPDEIVDQMLEYYEPISVVDNRGLSSEQHQIERLLKTYHLKPHLWRGNVLEPIGSLLHTLMKFGRFTEFLPKVAGHLYLQENFPDMPPEYRAELVRSAAGSPPFLYKGRISGLLNGFMLFYNPMIQDIRANYQAYNRNKIEYVAKRTAASILSKTVQFLIYAGAIGTGAVVLRKASEYNLANYTCIPIGLTKSGKGVIVRIPQDEFGRMIGGIYWKMLNAAYRFWYGKEGDPNWLDMFNYMGGQAPNFNPLLDIMADVYSYTSGQPVLDRFRGTPALREEVFRAKDMRTHKAFLKYLLNKAGAGVIYQFDTDDVDRIKGKLEAITSFPWTKNILGRLIMVTDSGIYDENKSDIMDSVREEARRAQDVEGIVKKIMKGKEVPGTLFDAIRHAFNREELTQAEIDVLSDNEVMANNDFQRLFAKKNGYRWWSTIRQCQNDECRQKIYDRWKKENLKIEEYDRERAKIRWLPTRIP